MKNQLVMRIQRFHGKMLTIFSNVMIEMLLKNTASSFVFY